ncbi:MAG: DUF2949 domain-containing protein [Calothrix sp. FI2-JRJ7]|jgi:hypothetical protein|nr:DUF2949 domain-containing protein [Calothrix sp. FI2-JRJ7]
MAIHTTQGGEKKMSPSTYSGLIDFLQEDLAISSASIAVALRRSQQDPGPLPMILWQYGLITLDQLERIYDWLETSA